MHQWMQLMAYERHWLKLTRNENKLTLTEVNFQQTVLQIKITVGYFTDKSCEFREIDCIKSVMSSILLLCALFLFLSLIPEDGCSTGTFLLFSFFTR